MSSNNNNEMNGAAMAFAFVAAGVAILFILVYVVAAFLALVLTLLCLWAWDEPRTLGKTTITPHEARRFVRNGALGAVGLPVLIVFASALLGFRVEDWLWLHFMIAGYVGGSIGVELILANLDEEEASARVINDAALPPPAPSSEPAQPEVQRFRFASWDEEEDDKP